MKQFIITGLTKGTYGTANPVTTSNLLPIGGGGGGGGTVSGDYLPLTGGTVTGDINIGHTSGGIYFGTDVGGVAYIRKNGTGGQVEIGSDNAVYFKETDADVNAVTLTTNDGIIDATGGYKWNGQSLDVRYALASHTHNYDNYGSWNLKTNGVQRTTVGSGGVLDIVGGGTNVSVSYGAGGVVTITTTDTNTWRGIDDVPVDGATSVSISSNWAYDITQTINGKANTTGTYAIRATSTTKADVGLSDVPNWSSATFDGRYVNRAGNTITGKIEATDANRSAGMYGNYNATKIGHVWSMGTAYTIPDTGANFGNIYGMAYKHTNNTTGGTMAGGHQIVFCNAGSPGTAIGLAGGIWTSGNITGAKVYATAASGSLRSIKKNITPYEKSALDIWREMEIHHFDYKDESTLGMIGPMADDESTSIDILTEDSKAINLHNAIFVAGKAIQEMDEIIENQNNKIQDLVSRLETLEKLINK